MTTFNKFFRCMDYLGFNCIFYQSQDFAKCNKSLLLEKTILNYTFVEPKRN